MQRRPIWHYILGFANALAAFFAGYPLAFIVILLMLRDSSANKCPQPPCEGPGLLIVSFVAIFGSIFGMILSIFTTLLLNSYLKKRWREPKIVTGLP